ncbi:MAG: response regulator [Candidatus Berkiella sp.]
MDSNILMVDDEKTILKTLVVQLGMEEYQVFSASSAQEGLKILAENDIAVVLSDQRMPEMTGSDKYRNHYKWGE